MNRTDINEMLDFTLSLTEEDNGAGVVIFTRDSELYDCMSLDVALTTETLDSVLYGDMSVREESGPFIIQIPQDQDELIEKISNLIRIVSDCYGIAPADQDTIELVLC